MLNHIGAHSFTDSNGHITSLVLEIKNDYDESQTSISSNSWKQAEFEEGARLSIWVRYAHSKREGMHDESQETDYIN